MGEIIFVSSALYSIKIVPISAIVTQRPLQFIYLLFNKRNPADSSSSVFTHFSGRAHSNPAGLTTLDASNWGPHKPRGIRPVNLNSHLIILLELATFTHELGPMRPFSRMPRGITVTDQILENNKQGKKKCCETKLVFNVKLIEKIISYYMVYFLLNIIHIL